MLANASFEEVDDSSGSPTFTCWATSLGGTNQFELAPAPDAHDGALALSLQVTQLTSPAIRVVAKQDMGQCAPLASPGHAYDVAVWYRGEAPPRLVAYWRDGLGMWRYFHSSKAFAASPGWTRAEWTTDPLPSGATAISVGFEVTQVGSITVDDASLVDTGERDFGGHGGCVAAPARSACGESPWDAVAAFVWLVGARIVTRRSPRSDERDAGLLASHEGHDRQGGRCARS
jgi:hypothetical protein